MSVWNDGRVEKWRTHVDDETDGRANPRHTPKPELRQLAGFERRQGRAPDARAASQLGERKALGAAPRRDKSAY